MESSPGHRPYCSAPEQSASRYACRQQYRGGWQTRPCRLFASSRFCTRRSLQHAIASMGKPTVCWTIRGCAVSIQKSYSAKVDDKDVSACLTSSEVKAIARFYEGPRDPATGERLTVGGVQYGSELAWAGVFVPESADKPIFSTIIALAH